MGYGLLQGESQAIEYGVLTASGHWPLGRRLWRLHQQLVVLLTRLEPAEIAVEEPFLALNARTAFALGQAQAVALMAAAARDLPVFRYPPTQVKLSVTGYGAGGKAQVQEMVRLQLSLRDSSPSPDAFDALAVALCHFRQREVATLARQATTHEVGSQGRRP